MHWQQDLKDANPPNLDTTGSRAVRVDCCTAVVTDWNDSLGKPFTKRSCRHDNRHKDWEVLAQTAHRSDLTVEAARYAMWRAHFALETRKVHYLSTILSSYSSSVAHACDTQHTLRERVTGCIGWREALQKEETQCERSLMPMLSFASNIQIGLLWALTRRLVAILRPTMMVDFSDRWTTTCSDRPNLAMARASAELFGRSFGQSSFGGDVTEAEAYLFTILDTFAVLFVQFFNFFW